MSQRLMKDPDYNFLRSSANNHRVSINDSDVARYNFNAHQPIFGKDITERIRYRMCFVIPTSPN